MFQVHIGNCGTFWRENLSCRPERSIDIGAKCNHSTKIKPQTDPVTQAVKIAELARSICHSSATFWGSSNSLPARPPCRFYRQIRRKTSFCARMCLLGPRKRNLTFWPTFPPNTILFGPFSMGLKKVRLKTGFHMGDHIS